MNELQNAHQLLKDFGCEATFPGVYPEMQMQPIMGGSFFYRLNSETGKDYILKEWKEKVSIKLDVCLRARKSFSQSEQIRFDIEYSSNANLYSMYVSLPTSGKSTPLSHERYKTELLLMREIEKWIAKAGCKRIMPDVKAQAKPEKFEQLSLF